MVANQKPPRKRPARISVTLTTEGREALERFTEVTGIAAAQYITTMVHDSIPVIHATTEALRLARSHPQKAAGILNDAMVGIVGDAVQGKLAMDAAFARHRPRRRPRKS